MDHRLYSRWDGTQEPFPVHLGHVMDQLSQHLMGQSDVTSALRSILQRGVQGPSGQRLQGLQDLLQSLRQTRQQLLDRSDLGSVMDGLKERLGEVRRLEEEGVRRRLADAREQLEGLDPTADTWVERRLLERLERMAAESLEFIRGLPEEPAGAIALLRDYDFMDQEARDRFRELLESLQQQALGSYLKQIAVGLKGLTPQDRQAIRQMAEDLNRLLEEKARGGEPDYQSFLERHRRLLGPTPPESLDELVRETQRQAAHLESLLRSLPPQARDELRGALEAALQDEDLAQELARLAANLESLYPMGMLRREYPFQGQEPTTLDQAMALMEELQHMDALERQLRAAQQGGGLEAVDRDAVRDLLGPEAARDLEHLTSLSGALEEAGYLRGTGARLELTPKGMRQVGRKALREIFSHIKRDRAGQHHAQRGGGGVERLEETKEYEFGDPFDLDLKESLLGAVGHNPPGLPVALSPSDFRVYRSRQLTMASTVLMLDLSLSMAMRGSFLAAKKVALALDNLIRTQFPRDNLYIVGFSTYAQEVKPEKLAYLSWDEFDPYTNIQHGLALSQKLLARLSGGTKQILLISDGEPTAHTEGGRLFLQYPPNPRTIQATLREVRRCTRKGITINTFLLDRTASLVEFVEQMSEINRGRVFYTSPERLGQYILVDYFTSRRRLLT